MTMKRLLFLLASALTLTLYSCADELTGKADVLAHMPADASVAFTFDVPTLMEKADFERMRQMAFYQQFLKEVERVDPYFHPLFEDPAQAGIDLGRRSGLFVRLRPEDPEVVFVAMVVPLADADAFAKAVSPQLEVTEQQGYMLGLPRADDGFGSNALFFAWDDRVAWIGGRSKDGWTTTLEEDLGSLAALEKAQSLASLAEARKALRTRHDATMWASLDFLGKNPALRASATVAGIPPDALQGNTLHGWWDWKDGEATGQLVFDLRDELDEDLVGRLFKDEPDFDIARHLPKGRLSFGLSMAFDLIGADQWLTEHPSTRSFVKFALQSANLTIEDAQQIFGGEVLIAKYEAPDEGLLVGIHIKDEEKLHSLLKQAEERASLAPIDDHSWEMKALDMGGLYIRTGKPLAILQLDDDILWVSPKGALHEALDAADPTTLPREVRQTLLDHPFGLMLDLSTVDEDDLPPVRMWTLFGDDGTLQSRLMFTNGRENSLRQLVEWIEATYRKEHDERERQSDDEESI